MDGLTILAIAIAFVVAVVSHEAAHAYVADLLGDPTARMQGRVTLNPIPHIDIFGTVLLPGLLILSGSPFVFGWAKPVPINPYNFSNPVRDRLYSSLAGPASNLLIATVSAIMARVFIDVGQVPVLFGMITLINLILMIFNLIPIPPLDGSAILPYIFRGQQNILYFLEQRGSMILILLIMVHFLTGGALLNVIVFRPVMAIASLLLGQDVLTTIFSI